jgi:hypothetical protein
LYASSKSLAVYEDVDKIISNGHNWAADHISTSKDDIEEVFNFLKSSLQNGPI